MKKASVDVADHCLPESALTAAFDVHRAQLTRFLRLRCGLENVDDLLQQVWLKAHAANASVERPLAYLYRIADRLVLDDRRGIARSRSRDGDWGYVNDRLSETVEAPTAERTLIARQRLTAADAALRAVGDRAAQIFRRYRIDGVEQYRIAEEFGISVSTVEKDLRKTYTALLLLQERFDEE